MVSMTVSPSDLGSITEESELACVGDIKVKKKGKKKKTMRLWWNVDHMRTGRNQIDRGIGVLLAMDVLNFVHETDRYHVLDWIIFDLMRGKPWESMEEGFRETVNNVIKKGMNREN